MPIFLRFLLMIALIMLPLKVAHGEGNNGLSIVPIYPPNQNGAIKGYFDLNVKPSQKQILKIKIGNNQNQEVTVAASSASAYTNPTGGIIYKKLSKSDVDQLLPDAIMLQNNIATQPVIKIPPKSSVVVPITVTVPADIKGTALGAVLFTVQTSDQKAKKQVKGKASFIIKTQTQYAIAIQLDSDDSDSPKFSYDDAGFTQDNGNAYITMNNDAFMIQRDVKGQYLLTDSNGKTLFKGNFGPFTMAPKSKVKYQIPWNNPTLSPGTYTLSIKSNINGETQQIKRTIKINNKQVENYQKNFPQAKVASNSSLKMWMWGIPALIVVGGLMYWLGRRKR